MEDNNKPVTTSNTYQILVIEDEQDMQELLREILGTAGFSTVVTGDGREGLELAKNVRPCLILLDLMLPGGKDAGIEVCRELAKNKDTVSIPVVVVTARQELGAKLSSFMAGAKRYVTKPFDVDVLLREVKSALRQAYGELPPENGGKLDPRD